MLEFNSLFRLTPPRQEQNKQTNTKSANTVVKKATVNLWNLIFALVRDHEKPGISLLWNDSHVMWFRLYILMIPDSEFHVLSTVKVKFIVYVRINKSRYQKIHNEIQFLRYLVSLRGRANKNEFQLRWHMVFGIFFCDMMDIRVTDENNTIILLYIELIRDNACYY